MDNEQSTEVSPQDELRIAQDRLSAAKARLEEADKLRLHSLQAKVASIQAEKERQAAEQRAEHERIQQLHIERRRKEREDEQRLAAEEAARNAALQAEIAKAEAAMQEQRKREALLQQLAEEAQAIEGAARAAQAAALADLDFIEAGVATKEIIPSATEDVNHTMHPLSRFFNPEKEVIPVRDGVEISSESQALNQLKIDALNNTAESGNVLVYAKQPATVEPQPQVEPMQSGRKPRPEVDHATSGEIEQLLRKELGLNPSTLSLDKLSSTFYYGALISATRMAIAQFKAKPMSSDGLLFLIEELADSAATSVLVKDDAALAAEITNSEYSEAVAQGMVGGSRG